MSSRNMKLTKRELGVLDSLRVFGGSAREWARPMDIGAHSGSHHHDTLRKLIRHGLVERKRRDGSGPKARNLYGKQPYYYRVTR